MANEFLSAVILLTLVIDPFGNVPLVNAMLSGVPSARRRIVIVRECAIAFVILLVFMFFGRKFLEVMHLSETSLSIAGGVILFMIAIRMVFGHPEGAFGGTPRRASPSSCRWPSRFIAGPSALATVMLMATREPGEDRHVGRGDHRHHGARHGDPRASASGCSAGWASAP